MNDLNLNSNNGTEGKIAFKEAENLFLLKEKLPFQILHHFCLHLLFMCLKVYLYAKIASLSTILVRFL